MTPEYLSILAVIAVFSVVQSLFGMGVLASAVLNELRSEGRRVLTKRCKIVSVQARILSL